VNLSGNLEEVKLDLQIAPLIDVVFLLLIYFMVTAALIKKEGDISFILPANVTQQEMVTVPVEVLIEVDTDGTVILEGMRFPSDDRMLGDLATQVKGLREIAASHTLHERIINVMDACAAADVESLTFSRSL
jgi:biopolymer transport protein ExbD